jgi:hypothetical protein
MGSASNRSAVVVQVVSQWSSTRPDSCSPRSRAVIVRSHGSTKPLKVPRFSLQEGPPVLHSAHHRVQQQDGDVVGRRQAGSQREPSGQPSWKGSRVPPVSSTHTDLVSVYSFTASMPFSRPIPLRPKPPKGMFGATTR